MKVLLTEECSPKTEDPRHLRVSILTLAPSFFLCLPHVSFQYFYTMKTYYVKIARKNPFVF